MIAKGYDWGTDKPLELFQLWRQIDQVWELQVFKKPTRAQAREIVQRLDELSEAASNLAEEIRQSLKLES